MKFSISAFNEWLNDYLLNRGIAGFDKVIARAEKASAIYEKNHEAAIEKVKKLEAKKADLDAKKLKAQLLSKNIRKNILGEIATSDTCDMFVAVNCKGCPDESDCDCAKNDGKGLSGDCERPVKND
ncbi:hypothetical protein KAR91_83755 [Candidatus Pacearchaeota archaeon]|nr:hypothetical protein [Candidatus Pacearchaeota archaeon]